MKYSGEKCSCCGKVFTDDDDIVVCSVCGTPQHRHCYRINGECVNKAAHSADFKWISEKQSEENPQYYTMKQLIEKNVSLFDNKPVDNCYLHELLDFVNKNLFYYMPVFANMRNKKKKISFNLVCFLFPQIYFAYRKMWFWSLFSVFISIILTVPSIILLLASGIDFLPSATVQAINNNSDFINLLVEICNCIDLSIRIFFCFFGNRLYYNFAVKSVVRIKKKCDEDITKEQLADAGGTKFSNIIIILLATFSLTCCVMTLLQFILPMIFKE